MRHDSELRLNTLHLFLPFTRSLQLMLTYAAVSVAVFVALSGCSRQATPDAGGVAAVDVTVIRAQAQDVQVAGSWVATLDGFVNVQIQPQVTGYLLSQNYREGSQVSKGQVIYQIDPRPFQAALQQAQGQLGQAEAQLALAEINVKRDTPLVEARAISRSQLDTELQQRAQDKAAVTTAEANVATAQINLGFTQVRSLIDGVAGRAQVQTGNLVGPSAVLTSVSRLNPIKAYFSISDQQYLALTQHARATGKGNLLDSGAVPLQLTLANNETYPRTGHIIFVDRQMNAQTGAIQIAAEFPNPGNVLRPGQFGRVRAMTEVRRNAISIPQEAIQELQGSYQVFVIDSSHYAHIRNVTLGPQIGQNWLVNNGIEPDDTVVIDGMSKLRDGALVNPHAAGNLAENNNSEAGK
jgi:membrane fusion protein, multidrug efflux system